MFRATRLALVPGMLAILALAAARAEAQCSSGPPPYSGPGDTTPPAPTGPAPTTPAPAGPTTPAPTPPAPKTPGPTTAPPVPLGPTSPGPYGPASPGTSPATPTSTNQPADAALWQTWWFYNRDSYLAYGDLLERMDRVTGYKSVEPQRHEVEREVIPMLERVIRAGGDSVILRSALIALARVDGERNQTSLPTYARIRLRDTNSDVQEAAILALGIHGSEDSIGVLVDLVRNTERGRKLVGEVGGVTPRQRSCSAYALGLVGLENPWTDSRQAIVDALLLTIDDDESTSLDTQVASVLSLGLLPLRHCEPGWDNLLVENRHICGGVQLGYLLDAFGDRDLDPWLRAHMGPAIGRLGAAAPPLLRADAARTLMMSADPRSREPDEVRQGCTIGLGLIADGDKDEIDVEVRRRLQKITTKGDRLSRRFALMSLARSGARLGQGAQADAAHEEIRAFLIQQLAHGRSDMKAWAALGLGVYGHTRVAERQVVSKDVALALRHMLVNTSQPERASACALALAVLRDFDSADEVLAKLGNIEDDHFRAYAALALGMMTARDAVEPLREILMDKSESPELQLEAAVGLRLLGHRSVVPEMVRRFEEAEEPADKASYAAILGMLRDGAAIPPLVAMLGDEDEDKQARASAAMALAAICDDSDIAWNASFSNDINYTVLTWTLRDPFGDGLGLLEAR